MLLAACFVADAFLGPLRLTAHSMSSNVTSQGPLLKEVTHLLTGSDHLPHLSVRTIHIKGRENLAPDWLSWRDLEFGGWSQNPSVFQEVSEVQGSSHRSLRLEGKLKDSEDLCNHTRV